MAGLRRLNLGFVVKRLSPPSSRIFFYRGFDAKLFVKGLAFSTTEERLTEAFSQFGNVVEAKVIRNKVSNRSKGFGYVTFATADEACNALSNMNGKSLDGRVVFVVDEAGTDKYGRCDSKN